MLGLGFYNQGYTQPICVRLVDPGIFTQHSKRYFTVLPGCDPSCTSGRAILPARQYWSLGMACSHATTHSLDGQVRSLDITLPARADQSDQSLTKSFKQVQHVASVAVRNNLEELRLQDADWAQHNIHVTYCCRRTNQWEDLQYERIASAEAVREHQEKNGTPRWSSPPTRIGQTCRI
ncbi:uncharacterized protein BCR38DRAFT_407899 [Pseudomassariella vexata]|uniref:Uncharacterized protein n=1 Tax=Pseudomassariella vexata TaxID=1141098 RepID=A0A1Y2E2Z0_9PEZI|nr:uncharacterized protein BCR38DRAFT_407899 [Pseudomassariella vexata]ORY65902.1 hypothetical protein BCR38DRAFT_407899 [Pseudomassariella vexata]